MKPRNPLHRPAGLRTTRATKPHNIWRLAGMTLSTLLVLGYAAYRWGLMAPGGNGGAVAFDVKSGQRAPQVADALKTAGLIRDRNAFLTYINFHGLRSRLKAGSYSLDSAMSGQRIAGVLTEGKATANRLVIPEGYRLSQIRQLLVEKGFSGVDFDAALAAPHAQAVLGSRPAGVNLEGYLFPDSYTIGASTTPANLVDAMIDNFGQRVGPDYVKAFQSQGLTLHQGLTLASIVEREVNNAADRPIVAQIFLKRLRDKMPLGSDVTVEYASTLAGVPFNLDLDSPYNTRKFSGLPPGPICNPGLSALDAVAKPATTDYTYFLSGKDGKTYFAKTYAEHQQNIDKYLK
jgi:UPF0755 protein